MSKRAVAEGWDGWDDYAPFYDWENARTLGPARRAVLAPRRARRAAGPSSSSAAAPAASCRSRAPACALVGVDRRRRCSPARRRRADAGRLRRRWPVSSAATSARCRSAPATLRAWSWRRTACCSRCSPSAICRDARRGRARARARAGRSASIWFPTCRTGASIEPRSAARARRRGGVHLTLVESVRQDRSRRLTIFEQSYIERRGGHARRASFRADVPDAVGAADGGRLERAGFAVDARARRLPRPSLGRARRRLDHPRRKRGRIFLQISGSFACPAIPSGTRSSTRRAPPTPSAARSSRASSRN